jgi:hypothetical protein
MMGVVGIGAEYREQRRERERGGGKWVTSTLIAFKKP